METVAETERKLCGNCSGNCVETAIELHTGKNQQGWCANYCACCHALGLCVCLCGARLRNMDEHTNNIRSNVARYVSIGRSLLEVMALRLHNKLAAARHVLDSLPDQRPWCL